jgi:Uncharacterized protein conserved in bacteria
MTKPEIYLWSKLRMNQINNCRFYRQKILGNYIVDFFCPKYNLVIEVDGGQHYSDTMLEADKQRETALKNLGMKIIRFTNTDVLTNLNEVVAGIAENMHGRT